MHMSSGAFSADAGPLMIQCQSVSGLKMGMLGRMFHTDPQFAIVFIAIMSLSWHEAWYFQEFETRFNC